MSGNVWNLELHHTPTCQRCETCRTFLFLKRCDITRALSLEWPWKRSGKYRRQVAGNWFISMAKVSQVVLNGVTNNEQKVYLAFSKSDGDKFYIHHHYDLRTALQSVTIPNRFWTKVPYDTKHPMLIVARTRGEKIQIKTWVSQTSKHFFQSPGSLARTSDMSFAQIGWNSTATQGNQPFHTGTMNCYMWHVAWKEGFHKNWDEGLTS